MDTILITGTQGKLGRETVRQFLHAGYRVIAADRTSTDGDAPEYMCPVQVDLLDIDAVRRAMTGCMGVVHLAAIPAPGNHPPEVLFANNTLATFNVLQAAAGEGIKRVAIASSGSIYGTAWSPEPTFFPTAPVTEESPLVIYDEYALSKEVNERTAAMFCRREGMSIACLRFHWIATPDEQASQAKTFRDSNDLSEAASTLGGYVDLRDAARACLCTIEAAARAPFGFAPLVITAADTLLEIPTEELIRAWSPTTTMTTYIPGTSSAFDISRSKAIIGWEPRHSWRTTSQGTSKAGTT